MKVGAVIDDDLDIDAWVDAMIAENGYAQIFMDAGKPTEPGYAYTIGVQDKDAAAELFCMGVAPDIAAHLFARCSEALADGRLSADLPDCDVTGIINGFPLRVRSLPAHIVAETAHAACARHGERLRVVQLILPDPSGRFPGDPDCVPAYIAAQDPDRLLARSYS